MILSKKIVSATSKSLRIAPTKVKNVISKIKGKTYKEALEILRFLPQKAGSLVWKTLYSAVSNATHNNQFKKENLIIVEAFVNQGQILKRMQPRSRGRGFAIQKKLSHITVYVTELDNQINNQNI